MKNNYKFKIGLNVFYSLASAFYIIDGAFKLREDYDCYLLITMIIAAIALIIFINMAINDLYRVEDQ